MIIASDQSIHDKAMSVWVAALRDGTPDAANIIARAIIDERERCAEIAYSTVVHSTKYSLVAVASETRDAIRDAAERP